MDAKTIHEILFLKSVGWNCKSDRLYFCKLAINQNAREQS